MSNPETKELMFHLKGVLPHKFILLLQFLMDYLQMNFKIIINNLSFNSESIEMIDQLPFCP